MASLPHAACASAVSNTDILSAPASDQWSSEFLDLDPVNRFRQAMRLQRSLLDDDTILHWYHFIMVAVAQGMSPRPFIRWEGIELSRHRKLGEDLYRIHGINLSFPRDMDSGEFIDEVRNPVTGKTVRPGIMALTEDPGYFHSPQGSISLDDPGGEFRERYGKIRREGQVVKIDGIRVPPATWPVTFIELGYEATSAALFDDPSQLWLPTDVSGAYVFPWPAWMEMGDAPGHMFAAWSGFKLRSIEQLPPEFLSRARAERPDLLAIGPEPFEREVPLPG